MLLADVAAVSRDVAGTRARLAKVEALASALRLASPAEAPVVVAWLSGELPQRQIGVGWAALRDTPPPAGTPSLTVADVDEAFTRVKALAGKGSTATRKQQVGELFSAATTDEQYFLVRLLSGELRQGALDGVMTEAVARASEVPVADVRRAVMLSGSLPAAAGAALGGGSAALAEFGLVVGRPVKPMLASSAPSIDAALEKLGAGSGQESAVEWKLDGVRVQAHVAAGEVRLFTRTLDDITSRLPEIVGVLSKLPVRDAVLDGELIALRADGRPRAFQDTSARAARDVSVPSASAAADEVPLSAFWFDALHVDGTDLLDLPYAERHEALARAVPSSTLMPRVVTASADDATDFFSGSVAAGHEGVVVKSLAAPYAAGRRGAGWIKVKPRHTLDLVVLAAEWGHGRRRGWLSNLHLGARDPSGGGQHLPGEQHRPGEQTSAGLTGENSQYSPGWIMLGKTFKGLTDELLEWQTAKLQEIEDRRDDWTVYPRPELVVEIAFDGVQRSPRYPGGVALRFARVIRYREDKPAAEADTIADVRTLATDSDSGDLPPALMLEIRVVIATETANLSDG